MNAPNSLAGKTQSDIILSPLYRGGKTPSLLQGYDSRGVFLSRNLQKNKSASFLASYDNIFKLAVCRYFALAICFFLLDSCDFQPALAESINYSIIEQIESGGNPNAVSNKNAVGVFQITHIAYRDFIQCNPESKIKFSDLKKPHVNAHIAIFLLEERIPQILRSKKIPVNIETILSAFNCGYSPKCFDSRRPQETKNYLKKYRGQL